MAETLTRRDIWNLENEQAWNPVTKAYALAVGVMQTRDVDDPTSWEYQAAVHGTPQGVPPDDFRNQCQHNTWFFLPWHRMYLYWFERIVRATIAGIDEVADDVKETWALPYWNYSRGDEFATLPPALREPELDDGRPNPLFVAERSRGINGGGALPGQAISLFALDDLFFATDPEHGVATGFGGPITGWHYFDDPPAAPGAIEQTPHNVVHGQVGGLGGFMSQLDTAPLDPVFWLHHANIDRLWVEWLGREGGRANPTQDAWLGFRFDFHDEQADPVQMSPNEVLLTTDLGYTYEDVGAVEFAPEGDSVPPEPPPDRPPELVGATEEGLVLTGQPLAVPVPLEGPSGPALAESVEGTPSRVYLNVEGIEGKQNPGLSYAVYVNVPEGGGEGAELERHHVGNVSFFGLERVGDLDRDHPGGHGLRYAFDITDVVNELSAAGRWDPSHMTVTFDPLLVESPEGEGVASAEETGPPVKIGRVSLYYK